MKNLISNGIEVAPPTCIVCGKDKPDGENVPDWTYLAGSIPIGALTCGSGCTRVAVNRHTRTGRVDTPEMRVK